MAHLTRGLTHALHSNQFVVAPECAIKEQYIQVVEAREQRVIHPGNRGKVSELFLVRSHDNQANQRFVSHQVRRSLCSHVSRELRAEGNRLTPQPGIPASCVAQSRWFTRA